jgi:hypothetical protein
MLIDGKVEKKNYTTIKEQQIHFIQVMIYLQCRKKYTIHVQ